MQVCLHGLNHVFEALSVEKCLLLGPQEDLNIMVGK